MAKFLKMQIKWNTLSQEQQLHTLGKALDFPVYAARKILSCEAGFSFPNGDSKSEVARLYTHHFPKHSSALEEVMRMDAMYTECLQRQQNVKSLDDYKKMMSDLERVIPLAWEFARLNLMRFSQK